MHLMHHWDSVPDSAVAPSPIVPTRRRDPTPKSSKSDKRRHSSMTSSVSGSPESTVSRGSVARHQARSAGMAERPSRNESLSDLVRFFQTQNVPADASTTSLDTTTALPTVESPQAKEPFKEQLKPLHRRLLHFTQRQKKDPSTKSKSDDHQRQIEALQREGYLLPVSKTKEGANRSRDSVDQPKTSLDRSLSKSKKRDVETIGQPWLQSKNGNERTSYAKRRLASLDLDDFGSMVDVAVSLSEYDPSPPPYQPSGSNGAGTQEELTAASPRASAITSDRSSLDIQRSDDWPISLSTSTSLAETQESGSREDHHPRPSASSSSSLQIIDEDDKAITNSHPTTTSGKEPATLKARKSETQNAGHERSNNVDQRPQQPDHPPNPPANPPPSLKLFPDVAPPRNISKKAWRASAPRYQTVPKPTSSTSADVCFDAETQKPPSQNQLQSDQSSSVSSHSKQNEPTCPGALGTSGTLTEPSSDAKTSKSIPAPKKSKVRPSSLAMGTLQAFPLPAPNRPLPSVPKPNSLGVPADSTSHTPIRTVRSGSKALNIQASQPSPIPEEPREPDPRPATVLGHVRTEDSKGDIDASLHTTPERPKSTSPEQSTPRRRASSFHVPRMRGLPESPPDRHDDRSSDIFPLADSPILCQQIPTKPLGKRAARKGLQINPRIDRKNLPFGLPSPPPSAALPLDPPAQYATGRSTHRNYTAPTGAAPPKSLDQAFNPSSHRSSMISRSNSSRSSLLRECIPESYETSHPGSPLASSDDECFGPSTGSKRSHNQAKKSFQRVQPMRRGYDAVDGRTSNQRSRLVPPIRSMTPQYQGRQSVERPMSPASQYSQSTFRSSDSVSSHHVAPSNDAAQLLEDRVANLERQNQVLQAALMAALNAGARPNIPNVDLHESAVPQSFHSATSSNHHPTRAASRPDSWMGSSHSSEHSGFDTPSSLRNTRGNAR